MALVEVNDFSLKYISNDAGVLKDISFEVRRGEILAIFGPKRLRKITLLNVLVGLT